MLAMVDFDGTLIDTRNINYNAYKDVLSEYGYDLDYKQFCDDFNGINYKIFLRIIDSSMDPDLIETIHNKKAEIYKRYMKYGMVNESLVAMLSSLKSTGWKIVLVSAANRKNIMDAVERFSLSKLFDGMITQEDVKSTKPNPECFLEAMKRYNEDRHTSIIFEDSKTGIAAAEASGCKYYIVRGYS